MIKYLITIIFILSITFNLNANELEIIELHNKKTLDELVVEKINENNNELDQKIETLDNENDVLDDTEKSDINESSTEVIIQESEENNFSFLNSLELAEFENYLSNTQNIKSKVLYNEYINFLININYDLSDQKHADIFYIIIKQLYETGEISNAYNLIKDKDLSNHDYYTFFKMLEFNFLLSTHQLNQVCNLKNENIESLKIENNFLIKGQ